jgi:hypothetical protein
MRSTLWHAIAVAFAIVLDLVAAQPALACACCDGRTEVEPLGWSANGRRLLLRREDLAGCERSLSLAVHAVGGTGPLGCYDLLGNPDQRVACEDVTRDWERKPRPSRQLARYAGALRSVPPGRIAASYSVASDGDYRKAELAVYWLGAHSPRKLAELSVHEYHYSSPGDGGDELFPLEVAALIAPGAPRRAALLVRGMDESPGIGHRGFRVLWIELPEEAPPVTAPGIAWVRAIPSFTSLPIDEAQAHAAQLNKNGLAELRAGRPPNARRSFETAVAWRPAHVRARYNLACTLALTGEPQAALLQLRELLSNAKPQIATERRARAAVDPDFATLHDSPEFQQLICGGPCPPPAPIPTPQPAR